MRVVSPQTVLDFLIQNIYTPISAHNQGVYPYLTVHNQYDLFTGQGGSYGDA
jgi:hypothetical protein